jgi:uracil phosphoribosyltransferase
MSGRHLAGFTDYATMGVHLTHHPAALDALRVLRQATTPTASFRAQLERLTTVLVTEATLTVPVTSVTVPGSFGTVPAVEATAPVFVPVLRAGAALLPGALAVWPDAAVGFIGVARNEATLTATRYVDRVGDVHGKHVVILEPMLATGGSLTVVLDALVAAGPPETISVVGVVAAPDGVARILEHTAGVTLHFAALDEGLNAEGFIVPGLGDAGDRAWGC